MEIKANNILIGTFVLAILLSAFSFVYWMRNIGGSGTEQKYGILFDNSVSGLAQGGSVYFNGLKVGRVTVLRINAQDSRKVEAYISIGIDTPVRTNSRAKVTTHGLTGYAAIEITPGTPDAERLKPRKGTKFAFIKSERRRTTSIAEAVPAALDNVTALFTRLNDLIANNEDSIRASLKNVEAFTGMLDEHKDEVAEAVQSFKALAKKFDKIEELIDNADSTFKKANKILDENSENLASTLANVEKFSGGLARNEGEIDGLVQDVKSLAKQFKSVGVKLEKTLDSLTGFISDADGESFFTQAKDAAASFQSLAAKLDASIGDDSAAISKLAKSGLKEFELFMVEGRRAAQSLDRFLDKVEKNPQSLLLGGSSIPEYNPN